jgi:hypothetical protein
VGGIGNVVVNTVVRMFTRKAVGKAKKAGGRKKKGASKGENVS